MTTQGDTLAETLYTAYCTAVGGTAYDGRPLPTWQEFRTDPTKERQCQAWRTVAHVVKLDHARVKANAERLRKALVGLLGESEPEALKGMRQMIADGRVSGSPTDCAVSINAINALLEENGGNVDAVLKPLPTPNPTTT